MSNLNVDWSRAKSLKSGDRLIVEVPVNTDLSFTTSNNKHNRDNPNQTTSLLIITTPKGRSGYFTSVVSEPGYKEEVSYVKQPKSFNGVLLYHSLQGQFISAQQVKDGAVTGIGTPTSTRKVSKKTTGEMTTMDAPVTCEIFDVYNVTSACIPALGQCYYTYDYSYSYTVCTGSGGSGGGGGTAPGGGGGGGGGGTTPTPSTPPCVTSIQFLGPVPLALGYGVNIIVPTEPNPGDPVPCPQSPTKTETSLNNRLAIEPDMLLCKDVEKFRPIINERLSSLAVNRIEELNSTYPLLNPFADPFFLQKI